MEKLLIVCLLVTSFFMLSGAIDYCSLCNILCVEENAISTSTKTTKIPTIITTTISTTKITKYRPDKNVQLPPREQKGDISYLLIYFSINISNRSFENKLARVLFV